MKGAHLNLDAEFAGWASLAYRTATSFPQGLVYIVGVWSLEYVKIGRTSGDVRRRIANLQTACPLARRLALVLRGGVALERELHERFAAQRVHGEWFRVRGALGAFIVYCLLDSVGTPRRSAP